MFWILLACLIAFAVKKTVIDPYLQRRRLLAQDSVCNPLDTTFLPVFGHMATVARIKMFEDPRKRCITSRVSNFINQGRLRSDDY